MRIDYLKIINFKGFEYCDFAFDRQFTILIGENGAGKTSALEALAVAAGSWFLGLRGYDSRHISLYEVRHVYYPSQNGEAARFEPCYPAIVAAHGEVMGKSLAWGRSHNGSRTTIQWASEIKAIAADVDQRVRNGEEITLPVISYYGAGRLPQEPRQLKKNAKVKDAQKAMRGAKVSRFEGYDKSVDPRISVASLISWFAQQSWISYQRGAETTLSRAVRQAIVQCLDGAVEIFFDPVIGEVFVRFSNQEVQPFSNLSDGQRVMVAMVADIAKKAALLNPHLGEDVARQSPGLVLIDELDLHLHPRWQRQIARNLMQAFPQIQFICTTHSPQIIGELQPNQVLMLDHGRVMTAPETYGRSSGWIMSHLMGTPERNADLDRDLKRARDLFEDDDYAAARDLIQSLRVTYGDDPALLELNAAIDSWDSDLGEDQDGEA